MPLLHLRYFDDHSKWKDDLNFSTARASYSSAMILGCRVLALFPLF